MRPDGANNSSNYSSNNNSDSVKLCYNNFINIDDGGINSFNNNGLWNNWGLINYDSVDNDRFGELRGSDGL